MIAGVFLVSIDFTHVKTALHLKRIIFQQILAKVGAVVYEYYKNAFVERCEKETFKAFEFDSRQAKKAFPIGKAFSMNCAKARELKTPFS